MSCATLRTSSRKTHRDDNERPARGFAAATLGSHRQRQHRSDRAVTRTVELGYEYVDELVAVTVGKGALVLGSWRRRAEPGELTGVFTLGDRWRNPCDVDVRFVPRPRLVAVQHTLDVLHELVDDVGMRQVADVVLEYRVHIRKARDATRFAEALQAAGYR